MSILTGLHIALLTSSASRANGGVFEAVVAHVDMLSSMGARVSVFAPDDVFGAQDEHRLVPARVIRRPVCGPAAIGFAPGLLRELAASAPDIVHLHGIWMYPSYVGAKWADVTGKPYFISPHGMLAPWITERGRIKKAAARAGYERYSWSMARRFHALTSAEANDIRREYPAADTVVIPNAGPAACDDRGSDGHNRDVVFLGRIHPKKNVSALIDGWRMRDPVIAKTVPDRLVIAGWGDAADVADLERRLAALSDDSICYIGPVFGEDKAALLGRSRFMVLPSFSEGLPVAVLESWASGLPVIMSENCNLPEGFAAGAAVRCGTQPAAIAQALDQALTMPRAEWESMRLKGRALAQGPFGKPVVSAAWADAYRQSVPRHDGVGLLQYDAH